MFPLCTNGVLGHVCLALYSLRKVNCLIRGRWEKSGERHAIKVPEGSDIVAMSSKHWATEVSLTRLENSTGALGQIHSSNYVLVLFFLT